MPEGGAHRKKLPQSKRSGAKSTSLDESRPAPAGHRTKDVICAGRKKEGHTLAQCWKEHSEQILDSIQKRRTNNMLAQARKKLRSQISPDYKYQTMAITYHRPAHTAVASRKSTRAPVPTVAAREAIQTTRRVHFNPSAAPLDTITQREE